MEVERALEPERGGALDHTGIAPEATLLFEARAQMRVRRRGQPAVDLVEAAPRSHRGQRGGQRTAGGHA